MRILGKEDIECAQRLVRRSRSADQRGIETEETRVALAGEAGVAERLL